MDKLEQNKQIVQEGLNKRAEKRNKAAREAEQETITIQIFNIVNKNASDAETKRQIERNEVAVHKANNNNTKKIARLKKNRNVAITNMAASILMIAFFAVSYVINLTEMIYMIAASVLPASMFVLNLCVLVKTQKKLKRRA